MVIWINCTPNQLYIIELHHLVMLTTQPDHMKSAWGILWLWRREEFGVYEKLMEELRCEDEASFTNMLRVPPRVFQKIVDLLTPRLQSIQGTGFGGRPGLPVGLKGAITLKFLAIGDSYSSLRYSFRVAHNTISAVVRRCLVLLWTSWWMSTSRSPRMRLSGSR